MFYLQSIILISRPSAIRIRTIFKQKRKLVLGRMHQMNQILHWSSAEKSNQKLNKILTNYVFRAANFVNYTKIMLYI
jgi:hypothetical protein